MDANVFIPCCYYYLFSSCLVTKEAILSAASYSHFDLISSKGMYPDQYEMRIRFLVRYPHERIDDDATSQMEDLSTAENCPGMSYFSERTKTQHSQPL